MSLKVASRIVREPGKKDRTLRAALVGCDFPACDKAMEFPVNLQSSSHQCQRDTIKYIEVRKPHGWRVVERGTLFYCRAHAEIKGIK